MKKYTYPFRWVGFFALVLSLVSNLAFNEATLCEELQNHEVMVTAERIPAPRSQIASSVTVLDEEQIQASQKTSVADLLRGVNGVDVVQSGGPGGNVSVFMRGANSEHTLVIVDGIESNDPISPTRTFDFANFSTDDIERIEIVRGPQSVLYGSDAIGGVILITTKKGEGKISGNISAEGGSYGSFIEKGGVSGGDKESSYAFSFSQNNRDGFSAAERKDGNTEKDSYGASSFSGLTTYSFTKNIEGSLVVRYLHARSELDNFGGVGGDDPNREIADSTLLTRAQLSTNFFDGVLKQKIGTSFTDQWYDDNNGSDASHPSDSVISSYSGKAKKSDIQNIIALYDGVDLTAGYENETDEGSSSYLSESSFGTYSDILKDTSLTSNGYYLQGRWNYNEMLITSLGGRIDDHSVFGSQSTWRVGPTLILGDTKISATVGTGYKAPSIFQLYSSYGNRDLNPEESKGWDFGIEEQFFKKTTNLGVTFFKNEFDNLISFDPTTFVSENILSASSHGVEVYGSSQLGRDTFIDTSYTFTDTKDESTGEDLLRRARHKAKASLRFQVSEQTDVGIEMLMNGVRKDNDFSSYPSHVVDLGGYTLFNVTCHHDVNDFLEIFARIDNLFDASYQEVKGFGVPGASVFAGIKVSL